MKTDKREVLEGRALITSPQTTTEQIWKLHVMQRLRCGVAARARAVGLFCHVIHVEVNLSRCICTTSLGRTLACGQTKPVILAQDLLHLTKTLQMNSVFDFS